MIGKILIEINRLKNELDGYSAKEGLDYIKSYINTLSKQQVKEPDKSLEEEIRKYLSDRWKFGCCTPVTPVVLPNYTTVELEECANHFAQWQKEQMLKDAYVESQIVEDGRIELEGDPLPCLNPIILLPYPQFNPGDKVRIVILKAEEE